LIKTSYSDEIIIVFFVIGFINVIVDINLVAEETSDTTKPFAELVTIR